MKPPKAPILHRLHGFIWRRRHDIYLGVRKTGIGLLSVYRLLPLPQRVRILAKDVLFSCIERFIIHTSVFQSWREEKNGVSRIAALSVGENFTERFPQAAPTLITEEAWDKLETPTRAAGTETVDIILPVYDGYDETLACLYSALTSDITHPHELIVIYDAGPNPKLLEKLRSLSARGLFTLYENEKNLGFVQTVNIGMALNPERDVLLLNADTEVYNDWLDRIRATAYLDAKIATVTPFSNNAEICSYPFYVRDNYMPLELPFAELDALAAQANKGKYASLPTAVGFCMYIKRAALKEIGLFDAVTFGRGYGEENDFCVRAAAAGWDNVLAADVFVRHVGGTSFGSEKQQRIKNALKQINRRYPHYRGMVRDFVTEDPLFDFRRSLDLARAARLSKSKSLLMINHNLGGGTERHVLEMAMLLSQDDVAVYLLQPTPIESGTVALSAMGIETMPNLVFDIHQEHGTFLDALRQLTIQHIHIHHLIGFPPAFVDFLQVVSKELKLRTDVTLHDYYTVCPRINMIDGSGVYCGEPAIEECERCVKENPSHAGSFPVWQWRYRFGELLANAENIYVPNADVAHRMQRYFADSIFHVRPHPEQKIQAPNLFVARQKDEPLRVALLGALGPHKGSHLIRACAKDALARNLPISYHIIGPADIFSELKRLKNVTITGSYQENEVFARLAEQRCHLALFSSVCPETYSYTLSIAMFARIFPVSFALGAIAERIHSMGWGEVLPVSLMQDAKALNDRLLELEPTPPPAELNVPDAKALYPSFFQDYYQSYD